MSSLSSSKLWLDQSCSFFDVKAITNDIEIQRRVYVYLCIPTTTTTTPKSLQSCLTLCDPIDGSPPGSPVPEILQARTLEWVAISFSNAWKWKVKVKSLSHVRLFVTPWTAAYQAPLSMGFSIGTYIYTYGWFMLRCDRRQQNSVKQLSFI